MTYDPYSMYATCGPGSFQYIDDPATSTTGTQQCPPCANQQNCSSQDLSSSSQVVVCAQCPPCNPGQRIVSWEKCNGTTTEPFLPTCAPCTLGTNCSVGQYVAGTCTGRTTIDTQRCVDCKSCPYGFYHSTAVAEEDTTTMTQTQVCDGKSTIPSDGVTDCQRCDTCPNGQYASDVRRCTGNGIWKVF